LPRLVLPVLGSLAVLTVDAMLAGHLTARRASCCLMAQAFRRTDRNGEIPQLVLAGKGGSGTLHGVGGDLPYGG
jgi:hypothetical protein